MPRYGNNACCVPNCKTGYNSVRKMKKEKGEKNPSTFSFPKDPAIQKIWIQKIKRGDRQLDPVKDVVCELHFQSEFIDKVYIEKLADGTIFRLERGCAKLKPGAVPIIFPNSPSYLTTMLKHRKSPKKRSTTQPDVRAVVPLPLSPLPPTSNTEDTLDVSPTIEVNVVIDIGMILPPGWRIIQVSQDQKHLIMFLDANDNFNVVKRVVIDSSGKTSIFVGSIRITVEGYEIVLTSEAAQNLVKVLHPMKVCPSAFHKNLVGKYTCGGYHFRGTMCLRCSMGTSGVGTTKKNTKVTTRGNKSNYNNNKFCRMKKKPLHVTRLFRSISFVLKERYLTMPLSDKRHQCTSGNCVLLTDVPTWKSYFTQEQPRLRSLLADLEGRRSDLKIEYATIDELNSKVSVFKGDITKLEVDAIVNAANNTLLGGGGVDGAIHRAAGPELLEECRLLNGCKTGQAKLTAGYRLPAKHVIHTVGPRGEKPDLLQSCYEKCLEIALKDNLRSVAFPCISTGIYGYPQEAAALIALKTVRTILEKNSDNFDRVIFCTFLPEDVAIYESYLQLFFPIS